MELYLEEFKKRAIESKEKGKLAMLSSSAQHLAYKEIGSDVIHVRYACPCGQKDELHESLAMPYKVKCSACKKPVWVSKIKKRRGKTGSDSVAI